MRSRPLASMDAATLALILVGAVLLAMSIVGVVVMARPTSAGPGPSTTQEPSLTLVGNLPADHVATILRADGTVGASSVARVGDRVDVLGYFPRQVTGEEGITRVLVADVIVLAVGREAGGAALTLAVPQEMALLMSQAQALGARPYVVLRPGSGAIDYPPGLTDSELAARLAASSTGQVAVRAR